MEEGGESMAKVTVIVENTVGRGFLIIAEYGLALTVETGVTKFLVDTGQRIALTNNAQFLGIDLKEVEFVVLTHGHVDHTGGVKPLFGEVGEKILLGSRYIFGKKYYKGVRDGVPVELFIGFPYTDLEVDFVEGIRRPEKGVTVVSDIPMRVDFECVEGDLYIKTDGGFEKDKFEDEIFVVLETENGLSIISGCSHRGIVNTLERAREVTGSSRFYAVIGGFHLMESSDERLEKTISALNDFKVRKVATGHCTGFRATCRFMEEFGGDFIPLNVGVKFQI